MEDRRITKKILTQNAIKTTKHGPPTVKIEETTYSSRGRNRPSMD
jgi:hypothetical protein